MCQATTSTLAPVPLPQGDLLRPEAELEIRHVMKTAFLTQLLNPFIPFHLKISLHRHICDFLGGMLKYELTAQKVCVRVKMRAY